MPMSFIHMAHIAIPKQSITTKSVEHLKHNKYAGKKKLHIFEGLWKNHCVGKIHIIFNPC